MLVVSFYFSAPLKNLTWIPPLSLKGPSYGQLVVLPVVYVARQLHHLFLQMFTDSANANIFCDSLTSSTEFYFDTSRSYHEKE